MRRTNFWFTISVTLALLVMALILPMGAGAASNFKILYRFQGGSDGADPTGSLIIDTAGNLYGTTFFGGDFGAGTVFKLTRNSTGSWTHSVLYNFTGGADGANPAAGLIFDSAGNLYGTTVNGGLNIQGGVVFQLTPNVDGKWTEIVLHSFDYQDGVNPTDTLIFDKSGNLYGTAYSVGPGNQAGTVFKLTPSPSGSWTYSVLHAFSGGAGGGFPHAGLTFDSGGNLYGTTTGVGQAGDAVVYKLAPNTDGTWTYSVLYNFTGRADGANPVFGVIFDKSGNLYGTTPFGGSFCAHCDTGGCGVVFELKPNLDGGWTESVIHLFEGFWSPFAGLTFDAAGNLYGTASNGGSAGGDVFKLTPNRTGSWAGTTVHTFYGKPAQDPYGSLVLDKAGNFYGTTPVCGKGYNCSGVVFEVAP